MEETKNLAELCRDISNELVEALSVVNILYEISDGDSKQEILLKIINKNIRLSFENIEKCRSMIAIVE